MWALLLVAPVGLPFLLVERAYVVLGVIDYHLGIIDRDCKVRGFQRMRDKTVSINHLYSSRTNL